MKKERPLSEYVQVKLGLLIPILVGIIGGILLVFYLVAR